MLSQIEPINPVNFKKYDLKVSLIFIIIVSKLRLIKLWKNVEKYQHIPLHEEFGQKGPIVDFNKEG